MNGFGVNFQPGSGDPMQQRRPEGSQQGVQEAIKVLSLRLPKVVGAQASAPTALLGSQGSGGRPHVDSIVESVLAKYFPTAGGGGESVSAPMIPDGGGQPQEPQQAQAPSMPNFSGLGREEPRQQQPGPVPDDFLKNFPRIIVGLPPGDQMVDTSGRPINGNPMVPGGPGGGIGGIFEQLPDLRRNLDWLQSPGGVPDSQPPMI